MAPKQPFGGQARQQRLGALVLLYAIAASAWNIVGGYAGQVSLGTGGFMAVGAYATYKLSTAFPEISLLIHILLAGGITAAVGVVFGLPSLRIKGFYLAVATLLRDHSVAPDGEVAVLGMGVSGFAAADALLTGARGFGHNDFKIPLTRRVLVAALRDLTGEPA